MNCKQGDLAINVGGNPHARGEIYKVLREYKGGVFSDGRPAWWVEHRGYEWHCHDHALRPLRGNSGQDETLQWCDVPTKEHA